MIIQRVLLCLLIIGSTAFSAEPITLQAGRVSMVFEPDNAFVRNVRVGEHKVLQGISAPVRDQYWGTVPPTVSNVRIEEGGESFHLTYDVTCRQGAIDFTWHGGITGDASGRVKFTFDGEAHSDFLRNRIGFCVLHGPEAAGMPCLVETVDGATQEGRFPEFIAPHQPFKNIRAISHELTGGVWARVLMEGDTFEMEDQRNWTDASFKTYCTPLDLPFPVPIAAGTRVAQRIEISFDGLGMPPDRSRDSGGPVVLRVAGNDNARQRLPQIGLQVSSQNEQLSDADVRRLRELHLDHLRVDVTPADPSASAKLRRAADQAKHLEVKLHVGLHLGEGSADELDRLAATLKNISPPSTWLLISANEEQVSIAREFLLRAGQNGRLGRGEVANFTELNRMRPDPTTIDVISYGMNPQVHAFDDTSITETLEIQGHTVRSAKQFAGDRPLLISPITLKKQAISEPPPAGELPSHVDPRQMSQFAAGWTLGSIKYLAEAGVESVTYYETVGWLGIMESESGSPLPQRFPSRPGQLFPIYFALRELGQFAGGHVRETSSSDPMTIIGLAVEKGNQRRLLLANLTPVERRAHVLGFGNLIGVRRLDANGFAPVAGTLPSNNDGALFITLPPHGLAVLESRE